MKFPEGGWITLLITGSFCAAARYRLGTDAIEVIHGMAPDVVADYPNVVFFAGQLVFQEENFFNKLLHNQTAFLAQKMLVFAGYPMIVMPIRVLE